MISQALAVASALLLWGSALFGVGYSGASWTAMGQNPLGIGAALDWTPPSVAVSALPLAVQGTAVSVSATASDARSSVGSLSLELAPSGSSSWTTMTGCTSTGTNPVTRTCTWNTTATADGDYQVRASATDTAGYAAASAPTLTSVANNASAVLTPLPAAVTGTVNVRGDLLNAGSGGTQLFLEYSTGGGPWTQLNGGCGGKVNPLVCAWNTSPLAEGSYDVRLRASTGQVDVQTGVVVDRTSPTATVAVPAGTLAGIVTMTAAVADPPTGVGSGVASVAFQYRPSGTTGWSTCGTDTSAPFSCDLNTSPLSDNTSYDLRAVATDVAGNSTGSAVVVRTVDNTAATISISNPTEGATVDGTVSVDATAQSPRGVTSVRFDYRPAGVTGWTSCGSDTIAPYSCSWATGGLGAGSYQLRAILSQGAGGDVTSAIRTVAVDHSIGTVAIGSPVTGTTVDHQASVPVSGTMSTVHGVTSVTLRATPTNPSGPTVSTPCSVGSSTFACTWATSAIVYGEYDLRAEMTQGNGVVVTSANAVHLAVDGVVASVALNLAPSPATGRVAGTETLTATPTSNLGVSSVRYDVSPAGIGSWSQACVLATAAPYSCSWDTTTLANATYDVRAVMTLSNGQTRTAVTTASVANLWGVDVQGSASPNGFAAINDTMTFTYSTKVDPGSLVTGWDGTQPHAVTVHFAGGANTTLTFPDSNLGQVVLPQLVVKNNPFDTTATIAVADDAAARTVVTLTLTQAIGSKTQQDMTAGTTIWTPSAAAHGYYVHNACATTDVNESGALDMEF